MALDSADAPVLSGERQISDVHVEFIAHWQSVGSTLGVTRQAPWPEQLATATARPEVPWTLAFDGADLRLTVGPIPLGGAAIGDALATFNQLRASTGLGLEVDPEMGESTSVRLGVPRQLAPGVCATLRDVLAGPLTDLLGDESLYQFDVRLDGNGLSVHLAQPPLPEVSDRVLPLLAGVTGVVGLEAPDGALPPGGVDSLLKSARSLLAGAISRGDLDVLSGAASALGASTPLETLAPSKIGVPGDEEFGPLRIVPFRANARPIDEARQPGTGCSEQIGLVGTGARGEEDQLWILFTLGQADSSPSTSVDVRMSASFIPAPTSPLLRPVPVPGLNLLAVQPNRVGAENCPLPSLESSKFEPGNPGAYVAVVDPQHDLLPDVRDSRWAWGDADPMLHAVTPDGRDPFTFAHLFKQRLRVELVMNSGGRPAARRFTEVDVFDIGRFGSLYERLITQLVRIDTQAQAAEHGLRRVYQAYHPWYPVLAIGLAKAKMYMRAVEEDICFQRRNLADPGWLMRVGLYLEFLTCLGIIEAVKDDYPDLLTAAERRCFEESPAFEEIRRRIDPQAWKEAWELRPIVFAQNPVTSAGPVDFRNLIQKETANLAFLEAHHSDLKHAVELAGPNIESAQQTWHQVFRDAERAVLDSSAAVFPEFRYLGAAYQNFVLWHERGKFAGPAVGLLPPWITKLFGDRDGVYPTAARRYRESMNEVAAWAKERRLMDYEGDECIPLSASLIESQLGGEGERFSALQSNDGYGLPLEVTRQQLVGAATNGVEIVVGLLRTIEIFQPLTVAEIWQLAYHVERRTFGAGEDLLVQGDPASSLSIIERGSVEVLVRQEDDSMLVVDRMEKGDIFGEFSLLTGQLISATVRAIDEVVVHQIPKTGLQPIIEARPELVVELSVVLADRRVNRRSRSEQYLFGRSGPSNAGMMGRLVSRMRDYLLS
jgi:hypothetical protein